MEAIKISRKLKFLRSSVNLFTYPPPPVIQIPTSIHESISSLCQWSTLVNFLGITIRRLLYKRFLRGILSDQVSQRKNLKLGSHAIFQIQARSTWPSSSWATEEPFRETKSGIRRSFLMKRRGEGVFWILMNGEWYFERKSSEIPGQFLWGAIPSTFNFNSQKIRGSSMNLRMGHSESRLSC